MRKPVFITGEEAAAMIADNATVATIGMTLVSAAETILKAIEQRFSETGSPRGLTLVHSCGQSDRDRGIQHFAYETMLSRIIGGHWGLQPRMMQLIADNKILAYCIPGPVCPVIPQHGRRRARKNHQGGPGHLHRPQD